MTYTLSRFVSRWLSYMKPKDIEKEKVLWLWPQFDLLGQKSGFIFIFKKP